MLPSNDYVGLPFEEYNCYGLVRKYYSEVLGISIPNLTPNWDESKKVYLTYLQEVSKHWEEVESPIEGDIIAMAHDPNHPKVIQHFGVYLGEGRMLHTLKDINAHVIDIDSPRIKSTIKKVYRWSQ